MGKARKSKVGFGSKISPLGALLFKNTDEDDTESIGPVASLRDQLLNVNIEEKINGLQSLAVLASNKAKVTEICQTDVVRIAAPYLCGHDQALRNATAGALRNLSAEGGAEVCEWLVNQDILTPLTSLINEYVRDAEWKPKFDASMRDQLDLKSDVFLQAINILWNLCESTSVALDIFNQSYLLEGLMRCLDYKVFGLDIAISTAQCLLVVSENNPKSWIVLNDQVQMLMYLLDAVSTSEYGHTFLSSLSAGILSNVPALAAAYATLILNVLSKIISVDHYTILMEKVKSLPLQENGHNTREVPDNMEMESEETEEDAALRRRREELPTDIDIFIRNISYLLDAQRIAAEIIANLCSTDEEEVVDEDDEELSESESVVDFNEDNMSESKLQLGEKLPVEVLEVIKSGRLLEKLWVKAQPITDDLAQLLRANSINLFIKIKNLRISSLLSLHNLCNSLTLEDLGGSEAIYNVWVELGQQVFKGPQDISILEPSTTLMRSALDKLKRDKEIFREMSQDDLQLMVKGITGFTMAEIRANWLRMLGTLGCALQSEKLVQTIVLFILKICVEEEDVWTISEGLDALMDIFADDDWNKLIGELKLPELAKEVEVRFKAKLRRQKRELKERYAAVQTVSANFSRFVRYIEQQESGVEK